MGRQPETHFLARAGLRRGQSWRNSLTPFGVLSTDLCKGPLETCSGGREAITRGEPHSRQSRRSPFFLTIASSTVSGVRVV